jgi:Icc-related predicted phosphoesterase
VGDDPQDPVHQGFECFHRLIRALQPALFLHGHVHPGPEGPEHQVGSTRVVNVFGHRLLEIDEPALAGGQ